MNPTSIRFREPSVGQSSPGSPCGRGSDSLSPVTGCPGCSGLQQPPPARLSGSEVRVGLGAPSQACRRPACHLRPAGWLLPLQGSGWTSPFQGPGTSHLHMPTGRKELRAWAAQRGGFPGSCQLARAVCPSLRSARVPERMIPWCGQWPWVCMTPGRPASRAVRLGGLTWGAPSGPSSRCVAFSTAAPGDGRCHSAKQGPWAQRGHAPAQGPRR